MIDENMIVEKSRDLLSMKTPTWKISELKLLEVYLAKINARQEKTRAVRFSKKEYEEIMELTKINTSEIKDSLMSLVEKSVYIKNKLNPKEFRICNLFSLAYYHEDEYGEIVIDLSCNEDMKEVFFNLADDGYLKYVLKNTLKLKSIYAIKLYMFLIDNKFKDSLEIDLDTLKKILEIENIKTYEEFKYLKRNILDKAQKDINTNTEIFFEYEKIKRGRVIVSIKFKLKKNDSLESSIEDETLIKGQIDMFNQELEMPVERREEKIIKVYREIITLNKKNLSDDEILNLNQLAFEYLLENQRLGENPLFDQMEYVKKQMFYVKSKKNIKNYYTYLVSSVQKNYARA